MAVTVTNILDITSFRQKIKEIQAEGGTATVLVVGDSMSSVPEVKDPRYPINHIKNTWNGHLLRRMYDGNGFAGELLPSTHIDETYRGGLNDPTADYIMRFGDGWNSGQSSDDGGMKGPSWATGSTLAASGLAGGYARIPVTNAYREWDPFPAGPFRYLDVIYGTDNTDTKPLNITVDGTLYTIATSGDPSFNNVLTIDTGRYEWHKVKVQGAAGGGSFGRLEGFRIRSGEPGIIYHNVAISGRRVSTLPNTVEGKKTHFGITAFGAPDLAIIMLGYNDGAAASYSAAAGLTVDAGILECISTLPTNVPVVYVIPPFTDGSTDRSAWWADRATNILASSPNPTCIVNCYGTIDGWSTGTEAITNGLILGDDDAMVWEPFRGYKIGDLVVPTVSNGHIYRCILDGNSSTTEPVWPTATGAISGDANTQWQENGTAPSDSTHMSLRGSTRMAESILTALDWWGETEQWSGYNPAMMGLDEARLHAVKDRIVSKWSDLQTALARDVNYIGTPSSGCVMIGHPMQIMPLDTHPIWICVVGGNDEENLDAEVEQWLIDTNNPYRVWFNTFIYAYIHPQAINESGVAGVTARETVLARICDFIRGSCFNNREGMDLDLQSTEFDTSGDVLHQGKIELILKDTTGKGFASDWNCAAAKLVHRGWCS